MTLRSRVQSAFTITELLVVVAVVALLIAVGTPAVISSLRSINRSLADTQLRVASVGARDAAIRNAGRGDAMAVFTFEPGQRTQVYVCLYAGTLQDVDADNQAIEVAQTHAKQNDLKIDYKSMASEDLVKKKKQFDVVLALEIIEHVKTPEAFVESVIKLVKPGGLIIFSTLNRNPKSFLLGIVAAEYILRWLPQGTHNWK